MAIELEPKEVQDMISVCDMAIKSFAENNVSVMTIGFTDTLRRKLHHKLTCETTPSILQVARIPE